MALILSKTRLRLTQAKFFGNPQLSGSVTQLTEGYGITLTPNPITALGTVALDSPLPSDWAAGNVNINSRNSTNWFNVVAYGADPTGAVSSTAAVQAAFTDACAVAGTVYYPYGTYDQTSGTIAITSTITVRGDSSGGSIILTPTNADGFHITTITPTQSQVAFYDLQFGALVPHVSGAKIHTDAVGNFPLIVENCLFVSHFVGIQMNTNWASTISGNQFLSAVATGTDILIDNTINDDQGDNRIAGNVFWSNGAFNIRQRAGGGTKIESNKFLGASGFSFYLDLQAGKTTNDLFIRGNSFEGNPTSANIAIVPDGTYATFLIDDNQFLGTAGQSVIYIAPSATGFVTDGKISGNAMEGGAFSINLNPGQASGVNRWTISDNTFNVPTTAAIQLPATATRVANLVIEETNRYIQSGVVPYILGDLSASSRLYPAIETLFTQTANSTTTANTLTTLVGTGVGSMTLPANSLLVGQRIRIRASGFCNVADGGAASKVIHLYLGGVDVASVTSGPVQVTLNQPWSLDATFTVRTLGIGGTVIGYLEMRFPNLPNRIGAVATVATAADTQIPLLVDLQYNNGNAAGSLTTTELSMEKLGW